jgi:hypothetical protein
MIGRRFLPRLATALALVAGYALSTACGGGGGGGGNGGGGLQAVFTAGNPTPGANTLSMPSMASANDVFAVQVQVTGINDFFGATFRVTFNTTHAQFLGFSETGSVLLGAGIDTLFLAEASAGDPSTLLIYATRQGSNVAGVDVTTSQLLITLNFRALQAVAGSGIAFAPAAPREVVACPTAGQACNTLADATLTWSGGTLTAN